MGTVRPAGKRALGWVPEIALVAATTIAGLRAAGRWVDPVGDPGIWWSTIYRLGNGETLYRDVYLQFGPLSPDLLSLGVRLFGASASYFLLANWIPAIAAALVLLRAASAALDPLERLAVAGVLLSESLLAAGPGRLVFPYAPGAVHALFFSVLALLIGTRARGNAPAWTAGLLSGLAFCTKQEIGLACALSQDSRILARKRADTSTGERTRAPSGESQGKILALRSTSGFESQLLAECTSLVGISAPCSRAYTPTGWLSSKNRNDGKAFCASTRPGATCCGIGRMWIGGKSRSSPSRA